MSLASNNNEFISNATNNIQQYQQSNNKRHNNILPGFKLYATETYMMRNKSAMQQSLDINDSTELYLDVMSDNISNKYMSHVLVDKINKVLFCLIPKTSCTMFKLLIHLTHYHTPKDIQMWKTKWEPKRIHKHVHESFCIKHNELLNQNALSTYSNMLINNNWRKLVLIRDPLERLLSAYLDKLTRVQRMKSFAEWINQRFRWKIKHWNQNHKYYAIHDSLFKNHFSPQYTYCNLDKVYKKYFTEVIYYHHSTIGKNAEMFLKTLPNANVSWFYEWGLYNNETMYNGLGLRVTSHNLDESTYSNRANYYRKYYDNKSFAQQVMNLFETDYTLFHIPYPKWIDYL